MRLPVRIAAILLAGGVLAAQDAALPVPATVTVDGLPSIPQSVATKLAPYGRFRRATLLAWHPEKREMLVSTTTGTAPQIHVVTHPGGPAQLTAFPEGMPGVASYSPLGGGWIVYRKDTGAAETHQLWHFRPDGEPVLLTDGKSRNGIPAWSKDGRIAFESNRRNGKDRDIYVMDPKDPSTSRMLMEVSGSWFVAAWAPDDRSILAVEMLPGNDTALWSVDVESGKRTLLTPLEPDEAPSIWSSAHYAPDGTIYAVSDRGSELPRLWRYDGRWTPLTKDGDSVESAAVSPDGGTIAVVFDRDASSRLELLDARTLSVRVRPALPAGQITTLEWHRSGRELGFTFGSVRMQGDVFSVDAKSGAVTRWTTSPIGGVDPGTLPEPEIVRWKSFDGRMISGVLYRPPSTFTGRRPVMINIHGGPNDARERPRFQGRSAYFLNELGIAIVYPNVRGSFGFGRSFEKLDDGRLREDAVKDVGALLDWIAGQPNLDPSRVMVTGASYGGYMTYAVAARYPERIRCAFAGVAISNFVSYLENTEPGRQEDRRAEYGDELDPKMRDFLLSISPVTLASRIKAPLMIAHGRQDARVPIAQAESMHAAVKANGTPSWLVIYEDAGHENFPRTQANYDFNFYTWIVFAEKYLLN
ncbi:MAG TPA: alpha/beta fold hydrolase [Vicinamibacterales bacterium]